MGRHCTEFIVLPAWVVVSLCFAAFAAQTPAAAVTGEPSPNVIRSSAPGDALPQVLFRTPINATWAANHAGEWKRRGVSGFLFQGVLDDLAAFPGESAASANAAAPVQAEVPHPPQWEALVREITAARRRLTGDGIEANFLQTALAPESAWFTDGTDAARARSRFTLAGEFCALTGLRGLALDTRSASAIHDFRWSGHRPGQTEDELRANARRFAVRALRAFIRACPKGEILLLADSLDEAGPLWFSFFEGTVEALGSAAELRLRLVLRDTAAITEPAALADAADRAKRRLWDRLDKDNRVRWERSGGIVLCLEPVDAKDPSLGAPVTPAEAGASLPASSATAPCTPPQLRYPVEKFRLLRDMALLRSTGYICVHAPDGGWWSVPTDGVEQFVGLSQGGAARVRFMPPPPSELDAYGFTDPFDGACRAGSMPFMGGDADVLVGREGSMVVAWNGLREPFRIETRQALIPITRLDTDRKDYLMPKDGAVTVAATDAPVLIGGLPVGDYALPASMGLHTDAPLEPGATRTTIRFGLRNPSPATLRGSLRLLPPETHSVGAALFPLSLVQGEKAAFERTLQGVSRLGETYRFTLSYEAPELPPVTRAFDLSVPPARVWRSETDGVPNGAPATVRDEQSSTTRVFWASPKGDVGCNELRGGLLWKRRLNGNLCQGPVALSTAVGAVTVVGDDKGRLWFLDSDGGERVEGSLGGPPVTDALRAHAFLPDESETVLALLQDGTLVRFAQVGTEIWRIKTGLKNGHIGRLSGPLGAFGNLCVTGVRKRTGSAGIPAGLDNAHTGSAGIPAGSGNARWAAAGFDAAGAELWRIDLPAAVVCGPVSDHTPAEAHAWFVGLKDGAIVELDAAKGGSNHTWKLPDDSPVTALAGPLVSDDPQHVAVSVIGANAAGVHAFGGNDAPLWSLPIPNICRMTASPGAEMLVVGTEHGELVCISAEGKVLWRDTRAVGAICGITTLPIAGNRCAVLSASADRFISALDGGPLRPAT